MSRWAKRQRSLGCKIRKFYREHDCKTRKFQKLARRQSAGTDTARDYQTNA